MRTQHHDTCRVAGRTFHLLIAISALSLALANSASAALIGVSLSYDGSVKSGITTGVEAHDLAPIFPPNPGMVPATNPPLPAPLAPAKTLSATITELDNDFFMGMPVRHAIILISGTTTGSAPFANPIDAALPYPVQFDASFYSSVAIPPGQMIALAGTGLEDGNDGLPFPTSPDVSTSGIGTQANPWNVHIGIPANLVSVNNGHVKVHLYYKFGPLIPEPATCLMMLVGTAGLACVRRR